MIAVLASGTELTRLTVLIGTLGVVIGFGLQDVVNNFVSGLILLYERPVQVGDVIEVGDVMGTVQRIGIRSSTVATEQGSEVVVPNAHLISNEVTNWTLSDKRRRTDIDVAVAEATSAERVRELLVQVAGAHPEVLKAPSPCAFAGFGNGAELFRSDAGGDPTGWRASAHRDQSGLGEAGIDYLSAPGAVCVRAGAAGGRSAGRASGSGEKGDPGEGPRSYEFTAGGYAPPGSAHEEHRAVPAAARRRALVIAPSSSILCS